MPGSISSGVSFTWPGDDVVPQYRPSRMTSSATNDPPDICALGMRCITCPFWSRKAHQCEIRWAISLDKVAKYGAGCGGHGRFSLRLTKYSPASAHDRNPLLYYSSVVELRYMECALTKSNGSCGIYPSRTPHSAGPLRAHAPNTFPKTTC